MKTIKEIREVITKINKANALRGETAARKVALETLEWVLDDKSVKEKHGKKRRSRKYETRVGS